MAITRTKDSATSRGRGRSVQGGIQHESNGFAFETQDARPPISPPPQDRLETVFSDYVHEPSDVDRPRANHGPVVHNRDTDIPYDMRTPIYVDRTDGGRLRRFRPHSITREVIRGVMNRLCCFAPTWRTYPSEMKDALYAEFQATYKFSLPEDEAVGRYVWDRLCQERYSNHMINLRNAGLQHNNTDDLTQTKGHPPRGMRVEVWDQFVDYWLSKNSKKRMDSVKVNRKVLPNASLNIGGSTSSAEHRRKMEKADDLKREYADDPNQYQPIDQSMRLEAASPSKKARTHSLENSLALSTGSCSAGTSPLDSQQSELNQSEIEEMNERLEMLEQEMQVMRHTVQQSMQQVVKAILSCTANSPRNPVGSSRRQNPLHGSKNGDDGTAG